MTAAVASLRSTPRVRLALLRLELRRNPMAWMLPPVAVLYWLTAYRIVMGLPAFWPVRSMDLELWSLVPFAPLSAGTAAWAGSRDGRRSITDQLTVTARSRWSALLAALSATTCWAVVGYLICVGAVYAATAHQGAAGGPLWWPPVVGVAAVAAACAAGYAAGALVPSRFTAPVTAIVVFGTLIVTVHPSGNSAYALVSPVNSSLGSNLFPDVGIFYHYVPDLAIDQVMFLAGLAAAALGALGLPAGSCSRWLRHSAAGITAAGVLAAGTALGLAGTAQPGSHGMWEIPALHDAASGQPISYAAVCDHSAVEVCVQPDFRSYLPAVSAALQPVLSQVVGLPGAPVRVSQVATRFHLNNGYPSPDHAMIAGRPLVLRLPLGSYLSLPNSLANSIRVFAASSVTSSVIGGNSPAQQAVKAALLKAAGIPLLTPAQAATGSVSGVAGPAPGSPVYAAAIRFAMLSAAARHAWLTAHLAALRGGQVTLKELP